MSSLNPDDFSFIRRAPGRPQPGSAFQPEQTHEEAERTSALGHLSTNLFAGMGVERVSTYLRACTQPRPRPCLLIRLPAVETAKAR